MNNSICTLFDNILIDIHKFKSLHIKQQTGKGIKTFFYSSNYIRVTNFTKLFHKYNINMTL